VLGTERSAEFAAPEGQRSAAGQLAKAEVEGLVVIGGNGCLTWGLRLMEGAPLSAEELHEYIEESEGTYDSRLTVVGHIQRGGIPRASDRILASRLGTAAVEALADGEIGVMVGIRGPRIERVPLEEAVSKEQALDSDLYKMAEVLAGLPE
jgi:6-phosphofructokinase